MPTRAAPLRETGDLQPGDHCGAFRIEKLLACGGMGQVYLAARDDDLELKAAVKTLSRWAPRSKELFLKEARILSGLRHPHIAQLLDAGQRENGQPWFAMQFVEGETMARWMTREDIGLRQRLAIFLKVCTTLDYAHRQMIIHRDLKPGNIMINPEGEPILLDFGVATVLEPTSGQQRTLTHIAERLLTPEYASPEQLRGERLSAASDVYSLGVVLYQLLCGERPYQTGELGYLDLVQQVQAAPITAPGAAGKGRFAKQLRGDLDTIMLKTLEKEPQRRYPTVAALAEDLNHYLGGRPIKARPAGGFYRMRKFMTRHPLPVCVTAVSLIFVAAFSVYAGFQNEQLRRERDLAHRRQQTAEAVTHFLVTMFEQVDPDVTPGDQLKVVDMMAIGREQLAGLDEAPETQRHLQTTMGRVYRALGDYDTSANLLEAAASGDSEGDILLELARTRFQQGEYEKASALLEQLEELGPTSVQQVRLLHERGRVETARGHYLKAEDNFQAAMVRRRLLAREDQFRLLGDVADLERVLGRYEAAQAALETLLTEQQETYGAVHSQIANTQLALGKLYLVKAQHAPAQGCFAEAERLVRRIFGDTHPHLLNCWLEQGNLALVKAEYGETEPLIERGLALATAQVGREHPLRFKFLDLAARLAWVQNDMVKAESLFRDVLAQRTKRYGEQHPEIASSYENIATLLWEKGDLARAEALFRQCLQLRAATLGTDHPEVASTYNNLALVVEDLGRLEEAQQLYEQALSMRRRHLGPDNLMVATNLNNLGGLNYRLGDYNRAIELFEQALAIRKQKLSPDHPDTMAVQNNLAVLLSRQQRYGEAAASYRALLVTVRRKLGPGHAQTARFANNLGTVSKHLGQWVEAEQLFRNAIRIRLDLFDEDHDQVVQSRNNLVKLLILQGRLDEAETLLTGLVQRLDAGDLRPGPALSTCSSAASLALARGSFAVAARYLALAEPLLETQKNVFPRIEYWRLRARLDRERGDLTAAQFALARARALPKGADQPQTVLEEAALLTAAGDLAAARALAASVDAASSEDFLTAFKGLRLRAELARRLGSPAEAWAWLEKVEAVMGKGTGLGVLMKAESAFEKARVLFDQGRRQEAEQLADQIAHDLAAVAPTRPLRHRARILAAACRLRRTGGAEAQAALDEARQALAAQLGDTHYWVVDAAAAGLP